MLVTNKLPTETNLFFFNNKEDYKQHVKAIITECVEDPNKEFRTLNPESYPCSATLHAGKVNKVMYYYFEYSYITEANKYFKNLK